MASGRSDTAPTRQGLGASHAFHIYPAFGCSRYQPIALPSGPRHLRGEADDQGIRHRTCWVLARWARACVRGAWPSRKTMHGGGAACQRRVPGLLGRRWHAIGRSREYRQSRGCRPKWCRQIAGHSPAHGLAGELRDGGGVSGVGHAAGLVQALVGQARYHGRRALPLLQLGEADAGLLNDSLQNADRLDLDASIEGTIQRPVTANCTASRSSSGLEPTTPRP